MKVALLISRHPDLPASQPSVRTLIHIAVTCLFTTEESYFPNRYT